MILGADQGTQPEGDGDASILASLDFPMEELSSRRGFDHILLHPPSHRLLLLLLLLLGNSHGVFLAPQVL